MYAKNLPVPPKFDYPYQEQQRYSGSFVVSDEKHPKEKLSAEILKEFAETAKKLSAAKT